MGIYYYGACRTCRKRVGMHRAIGMFDPALGSLADEDIEELMDRLRGGEDDHHLAYALAKFVAFVFTHAGHEIIICSDESEQVLGWEEELRSMWNEPLAHRRDPGIRGVVESEETPTRQGIEDERVANALKTLERARARIDRIHGAAEGIRHEHTRYNVADLGYDYGIACEIWVHEVIAWNARKNKPPLPATEVEGIVRAAYAKRERERGSVS